MTEAPPILTVTPDVLRSSLEQLRLEGAIFFRSEFTDAFEIDSSPLALADALHPGAERLILFHIVAQGSCWVTVAGGERHWAHEGDVIVLPYGDRYALGGEAPATCVSIETLIHAPPWDVMPLVHHGGGGAPTDLVCGFLYSDDPLFDPAMRALPPVFVVRPPTGTAAGWVQASIEYAVENAAPSNTSTSPLSTRLPELVLIEVLREHLATAPAADSGWIAALRDPVLAPALSLLHGAPERPWTVAQLASEATVSRSLLDERFRQVLGRPPIRYLTEWRMHLAEEFLTTTDLAVGSIGRRVGYRSEESFSRAFKRSHGASPSRWRAERMA